MSSSGDDHRIKVILTIAVWSSLAWSFLPSGLVFDAAMRDEILESGKGYGLFAVQWLPLILLSGVIIAARFRLTSQLFRDINPWLLLLLAWALLSMAWAPDPFKVFKHIFGLSGATMLGTAFTVAAWHPDRLTAVVRPLFTVAMVLSLLVGIFMPEIGIHSESGFELQGSWRGITYQKNGLGQLASVGMILWTHAWATRTASNTAVWLGMGLSVLLVLLSRSSTALLLTLIACAVMVMKLRNPLRVGDSRPALVAASWLLLLVPLFIYLILAGSFNTGGLAQAFGEVFGKDATFSGRTLIWAELMPQIRDHFLIGVGFNSFWGGPGSLADEVIRRLGWPCPSGHNGYLDVFVTLGVVGVTLLILMLVRHFRDIALLHRINPVQASLHLGIGIYAVLANLTESSWFVPISFMHLIAVYSSACVTRLLFDARRQLAAELMQARDLVPTAR